MNQGAVRLAKMFPDRGGQKQISEDIGVSLGVVSRWVRGIRKPDPVRRAKLEQFYGIGWQLWDLPDASNRVEADPPSSDDNAAE